MQVLIVDDSAVMRTMIARTLRLCGIPIESVRTASNGVDGLRALAEAPADLVLLDVNMPVMDGGRMLHAMRASPATRHLPVVIVSTEGSRPRISELRALGAGFVHKPFTPEMLRDAIFRTTGRIDELAAAGDRALPGDNLDF